PAALAAVPARQEAPAPVAVGSAASAAGGAGGRGAGGASSCKRAAAFASRAAAPPAARRFAGPPPPGPNAGGTGGGFGSGIFVQGSNTLTFAPASGTTLTIQDVIADQNGSLAGYSTDTVALELQGGGTVQLGNANTYSGGTRIDGATLELLAASTTP